MQTKFCLTINWSPHVGYTFISQFIHPYEWAQARVWQIPLYMQFSVFYSIMFPLHNRAATVSKLEEKRAERKRIWQTTNNVIKWPLIFAECVTTYFSFHHRYFQSRTGSYWLPPTPIDWDLSNDLISYFQFIFIDNCWETCFDVPNYEYSIQRTVVCVTLKSKWIIYAEEIAQNLHSNYTYVVRFGLVFVCDKTNKLVHVQCSCLLDLNSISCSEDEIVFFFSSRWFDKYTFFFFALVSPLPLILHCSGAAAVNDKMTNDSVHQTGVVPF